MLKLGLVSYQFINNDIEFNINQIERALKTSNKVDMLFFGEAFLQGFDSLNWKYENDKNVAINKRSSIMKRIENLSLKYGIDLAFGYIEKDHQNIYSSYGIIIDGKLSYNYRRISKGWKCYWLTDSHYQEGQDILTIDYKGKSLTFALCGDLWEFPDKFKCDNLLIWPVYVNFEIEEWKKEEQEYASQALLASENTLMINSISYNPNSYGGCFYFNKGKIVKKLDYSKEDILIIEL